MTIPYKIIFSAVRDMDFNATSDELIFSSGLMSVCANISIIDDQIPETAETFRVQLVSTNISRAIIAEPAATIIITDTDSMLQMHPHVY